MADGLEGAKSLLPLFRMLSCKPTEIEIALTGLEEFPLNFFFF